MSLNQNKENGMTLVSSRKNFSLIEALFVSAILVLLGTLLVGSLTKVREHGDGITCLNFLRSYALAYSYYLDDHDGKFPTRFIRGREHLGQLGNLHWAQMQSLYPEARNVCPTYQTVRLERDYSSHGNYRGYTGVFKKRIYDLKSPTTVGLIGDGVKKTQGGAYCWEIAKLSPGHLTREWWPRGPRFHISDFIHIGLRVNIGFADGHAEPLDSLEVLSRADAIWPTAE